MQLDDRPSHFTSHEMNARGKFAVCGEPTMDEKCVLCGGGIGGSTQRCESGWTKQIGTLLGGVVMEGKRSTSAVLVATKQWHMPYVY